MCMKTGEQKAKGRKLVNGLAVADYAGWCPKPIVLRPIPMHLEPLLGGRKVAKNQAHSKGKYAIGDRSQQRWIGSIRSINSKNIRSGMRTQMTSPGNNITGNAKQAHSGQAKVHADACIEGNGRRLTEQFCQRRDHELRVVVI